MQCLCSIYSLGFKLYYDSISSSFVLMYCVPCMADPYNYNLLSCTITFGRSYLIKQKSGPKVRFGQTLFHNISFFEPSCYAWLENSKY